MEAGDAFVARPAGRAPADAQLGTPRVHLRRVDSTNTLARELAGRGAPHGTLVTAAEQTSGRGRQGRAWSAPPGTALLCSWVIREPPALLSLAAGVAVAELCGERAQLKWPNDVLIDGRKVSGILVEGRPQERWAVLGIGINVALTPGRLPEPIRARAGTLGLDPTEIEPTLGRLRVHLQHWLDAPPEAVLEAVRARDALRGRRVTWAEGSGIAAGVDDAGRLVVTLDDGSGAALDAGEVHLSRP
ncbi:MAG TPA: biotin--[acetyl-CoA-carboxylase] ligase [Solirubrobacteraceae bacterium]|jgi:BirA family biotin operon repressor/biotin-[acetyl-CoA-carboxylase] ligase|nr:biotin--[acetyl-CoA-carboxylase] ligase [Solirubrobacteraceae bacterium]